MQQKLLPPRDGDPFASDVEADLEVYRCSIIDNKSVSTLASHYSVYS